MGTLDSGRTPWQTQSPPRSQTGRRGWGRTLRWAPALYALPSNNLLPQAVGRPRVPSELWATEEWLSGVWTFSAGPATLRESSGTQVGVGGYQEEPAAAQWAPCPVGGPPAIPPGSLCSWTQESREVGPEAEGRQGPGDRPHPGDCPPAPCPRDPKIGTPRATTSHRTPRDPKVSQPQRALSPMVLSPDSACSSLCSEGGARDPSKRLSGLTLRICPGGLHRSVGLTWEKKMQHLRIDARFVFINS